MEFSFPSVEAIKIDVVDEEVVRLLKENDPKVIARSYLTHRRASESAKLSLLAIFSLSRKSSLTALGPHFQLYSSAIIITIVAMEKSNRPCSIRESLSVPMGPSESLYVYLNV